MRYLKARPQKMLETQTHDDVGSDDGAAASAVSSSSGSSSAAALVSSSVRAPPPPPSLRTLLVRHHVFEDAAQAEQRATAMALLKMIVEVWIPTGDARLLRMGSYHLDVHGPLSDIDTVCLVPHSVSRGALFSAFVPLLDAHPRVSNVRALADAFVPVVKFNLAGIEFDFLCARRGGAESDQAIEDDDEWLRSTKCLDGMDPDSVRSLNGSRVAARILALVPALPPFRLALRTIRCWAKARGIYSNVLGYLGGINWAILVARVCQHHPRASGEAIIVRFFETYATWDWSVPVTLCAIEHRGLSGKGKSKKNKKMKGAWSRQDLNLPVWGDERSDLLHTMSLITPVYPAMNSSFNVSAATLAVLRFELRRAAGLVKGLHTKTPPHDEAKTWEALLAPSDFFERYADYIEVRVSAPTAGVQRAWLGWCESRLRLLIRELHSNPHLGAGAVQLLAHTFHRRSGEGGSISEQPTPCPPATATSASFYIGIATTRAPLEVLDGAAARRRSASAKLGAPLGLTQAWTRFADHVAAWRPGKGVELELLHRAWDELPSECCAAVLDASAHVAAAAAATAASGGGAKKKRKHGGGRGEVNPRAGKSLKEEGGGGEAGEAEEEIEEETPGGAGDDGDDAARFAESLLGSFAAPPPRAAS